jgi:hypothetical protein
MMANAGQVRLGLVVKYHIEKRTMYLQAAIIVNETKLPEFIHETLTRLRVVPISSANVSCDILPMIGSGWPSFP